MNTPTLNTRNLVLRPLTKATQRQIDWLRDETVVQFSEQRHKTHTLSSQLNYIRSFDEGSHIWGIYLSENDRHIGNLSARTDVPNNVADVGILIGDTDCWGHGYGAEAWRAVCSWLLDKESGNLRKLEAGCTATNIPMRRLLDHSGFQFEGERKNHFLGTTGPCGLVYYGRFR